MTLQRDPALSNSVSVVVPAHDSAATIAEALESVRAQTSLPDEVIVVDDGSSDGTADIVASRFPEVKLIRQANTGPAGARNRALEVVRSDWVAFLDADDVWEPDRLHLQLAVAKQLLNVVIVACNWGAFDGTTPQVVATERSRRISSLDLLLLNRFQTSTVLARTDAVRRLGGFDPELDGVEDWDLWLRCARQGAILKLDERLVRYRDTPASYSKNGRRVHDSMLAMLDRELPNSELSPYRQREVRAWHELRFLVGFVVQGETALARSTARELKRDGLVTAVPGAATRLLLPFLVRRRLRRLRLVEPLGLRGTAR
ncbi:MAG: glycosyltransferase family 2 protein [Acidimicrobiales bacterium]